MSSQKVSTAAETTPVVSPLCSGPSAVPVVLVPALLGSHSCLMFSPSQLRRMHQKLGSARPEVTSYMAGRKSVTLLQCPFSSSRNVSEKKGMMMVANPLEGTTLYCESIDAEVCPDGSDPISAEVRNL